METTKSTIEDKALEAFSEVMINHLESMTKSDKNSWKKPWFTEGALQWPSNMEGKYYNGGNAFILAMYTQMKKWKYPIYVTSKHLDEFNGKRDPKTKKFVKATDKDGNPLPLVHITKGEKSFPVMFYSPSYKDKDGKYITQREYDDLPIEERKEYEKKLTNRVYYVFNIDQTNLKETRPSEYEKIVRKIMGTYGDGEVHHDEAGMFSMPAMDAMVAAQKWVCPIKPTYGDDAFYSISKDCIVIPEKKQFKNGEAYYGNLWHEMSHSTGAEKRLNRIKSSAFGSSEYAKEELVAELSAALVGMKYGVEKNLKEDSLPYLANWLGSLKQSPKFIKGIMSEVKKAAAMVSEHIDIMQTALDNGERFETVIDVATPDITMEEGSAEAAKSI